MCDVKLEQSVKIDYAILQQSFTIAIKDGERLTARLIRASDDHDLALLKLDGYRTPALRWATSQPPGRGTPSLPSVTPWVSPTA